MTTKVALALAVAFPLACTGASHVPVVSAAVSGKRVKIETGDGHHITVPALTDQTGVEKIEVSRDGTKVGWLIDFDDPGAPPGYSRLAGTLVIWSSGKVRRRFRTEQVFYSWSFVDGDTKVSFHTGPAHGEQSSHCELHDIKTGNLLDTWDGHLDGDNPIPAWAKSLR